MNKSQFKVDEFRLRSHKSVSFTDQYFLLSVFMQENALADVHATRT